MSKKLNGVLPFPCPLCGAKSRGAHAGDCFVGFQVNVVRARPGLLHALNGSAANQLHRIFRNAAPHARQREAVAFVDELLAERAATAANAE